MTRHARLPAMPRAWRPGDDAYAKAVRRARLIPLSGPCVGAPRHILGTARRFA